MITRIAKRLLDSLTKKDNKDLRAEVLEDHLSAKRGSWSEDIHVQDLLCPRIWLEEIGAYRSYICSVLTAQEQEAFVSNPELIWNYVNQNITVSRKKNIIPFVRRRSAV